MSQFRQAEEELNFLCGWFFERWKLKKSTDYTPHIFCYCKCQHIITFKHDIEMYLKLCLIFTHISPPPVIFFLLKSMVSTIISSNPIIQFPDKFIFISMLLFELPAACLNHLLFLIGKLISVSTWGCWWKHLISDFLHIWDNKWQVCKQGQITWNQIFSDVLWATFTDVDLIAITYLQLWLHYQKAYFRSSPPWATLPDWPTPRRPSPTPL